MSHKSKHLSAVFKEAERAVAAAAATAATMATATMETIRAPKKCSLSQTRLDSLSNLS